MRLLCTLVFVITFSAGISAQDFAPVGAKWWCSQSDLVNPYFQSYSTIESVQDTVISNQLCKRLIATYNHAFGGATFETYYMYSEDRIIYQYSKIRRAFFSSMISTKRPAILL